MVPVGMGSGVRGRNRSSRRLNVVRNRAAYVLNDPCSVVFTFDIIRKMSDGKVGKICGTENAKNGFGAYTGKQFFFAGYAHQGDAYQSR